jgi:cell division protein FtsW
MKVACVLYAASFTVRKQDYMHEFRKGFLPMGGLMAAIGGLLLLQPDLGAFGVIVAIGLGILFLGGVNVRLFAGISGAVTMAFLLVIWLSPWRRARIFAYFDPCAPEQALDKGYQLCTSLISFARGDLFGVGLGGSVVKLSYLPEAHTDFILAVLGEELGLVGVLAVVVLFYWLVKRAFEIGRQAVALERSFAGLVAQGIARSSLMTIAMLALVETKGVGERHAGTAGGLFFSAAEIGGATGPIAMGALYDVTGNFHSGLTLLTVISALLLVGALRLRSLARRPG